VTSPNDRITKNDKTLSRRVWAIIAHAKKAAHIPDDKAYVLQGSWHKGGLSAGTHTGGGAADLSVRGLTEAEAIRLCVELRRWYGDAYLRSPKYGWPARLGGSHIHVIFADEPGLSDGAKRQVINYNNGKNALASNLKDPFPRPSRNHFGAHITVSADLKVKLTNLRYGKSNADVKDLQKALHILADGHYGPITDKAVRANQKKLGWTPDPVRKSNVGPLQAKRLGLIVV
jgi:hypothetical protein